MADDYKIIVGRIQFDPKTETVAGKQVRKLPVKVVGPTQSMVTVTLWPEYSGLSANRGDFLFAEGKFTSKVVDREDGTQVTYYDLSPTDVAVVPAFVKAAREVVNRPAAKAAATDEVPF